MGQCPNYVEESWGTPVLRLKPVLTSALFYMLLRL